jgi:hypothetical protein
MSNRNKISLAIAVSAVLLTSTSVVNAEIASDSATVTVQNAFTLTSTTPINFGTLRVSQSEIQATTPTFTTLNVDGSQNATDGVSTAAATITVITAGSPGRFDVSGAAPFSTMTITLDSATLDESVDTPATVNDALLGLYGVSLTTAGAGANDNFIMQVTSADTRVEGGTSNGLAYDEGLPNLRTDGTGAVGLSFGGKLIYNRGSATNPADGLYTGNYQITVNY